MRTWFTSDPHFLHPRVAALRGFDSVEAHDAELVRRWNDTVARDDQVWLIGDVGMGETSELLRIVDSLHGEIHLICGNHDPVWSGNRNAHRHQREWLRHFASIQDFARRKMHGQSVLLSHFPYYGDHTDTDRHPEFRLRDTGKVLLHGHVHDEWKIRGRQINVGVDVWGLRPVSIDAVAAEVAAALADTEHQPDSYHAHIVAVVDEYAHACPHCPGQDTDKEWVVGRDDVVAIVDRVCGHHERKSA